MKKIMFNDKYGLTRAVLDEFKTNSRRMESMALKHDVLSIDVDGESTAEQIDFEKTLANSRYKIGEEVAVAQSYGTMANEGGDVLANMLQDETTFKPEYCGAGWKNKMFAKADLVPHRIKITNIRFERLQDISNEDCLKEGIQTIRVLDVDAMVPAYTFEGSKINYWTPRLAFAALIDKVSGKGTWERNPWVYVYEFKLTK